MYHKFIKLLNQLELPGQAGVLTVSVIGVTAERAPFEASKIKAVCGDEPHTAFFGPWDRQMWRSLNTYGVVELVNTTRKRVNNFFAVLGMTAWMVLSSWVQTNAAHGSVTPRSLEASMQ